MDRNFALAVALSMAVLVLWATFIAPPPSSEPTPTEAAREEAPAPSASEGEPPEDLAGEASQDWPPAPSEPDAPAPAMPETETEPAPAAEAPEERIRVAGEVFEAELTTHGGGLAHWALREYRLKNGEGDARGGPLVELAGSARTFGPALATPFQELGLGDWSRASWQVERPDSETVVFRRAQDGVVVTKTYRFDADRYLFRLGIQVENGTDRALHPTFRVRWPASARDGDDFRELSVATYRDGDLHQAPVGEGMSFLGFGAGTLEEPQTFEREVDWAGTNTRYFLAALMPDVPRDAFARFVPIEPRRLAATEVAFTPVEVPPGQRVEHEYRIYAGPKEPDRLDEAGAHLGEAIQRGWFPSLTRFFAWLLHATYEVVPNYGVAIILLTAVVRILMAPIMARQMKSMKKMGELQPRIKEIQAKYPDDRQKQSEAMMGLYREAGVSPFSMMAGCFPMLLQLPVFIGFYFALQGSIDLRHQPFVAWIQDLSAPEALFVIPGLELPLRVLPLLMGASMVLQQKLSPTAMDPAQARMMLIMMPVMFTVLFYQFASGLVLYWLVSNLLGIAQQVWTNRSKTA